MVEGTAKFCSVDHCNLFSILYACNLQYFRILPIINFQKNQFEVNLKAPKCSESVELQGSRKEVMGICMYKNILPETNILNTASSNPYNFKKGKGNSDYKTILHNQSSVFLKSRKF